MYLLTATGLSPETVEFTGSGVMKARPRARYYVLRPETLESFFVLHQLTGDPVYREWGWDIFRYGEIFGCWEILRCGVRFWKEEDERTSCRCVRVQSNHRDES